MTTRTDTTDNEIPESAHSRLDTYSADLDSAAIVAEMAANQCGCDREASGAFDVLQRELRRLSWNVGAVAQELREGGNGASEPKPGNVTESEPNDGPALALSVLYEANDLLNILREHDTQGAGQMSSGAWTITGEISKRLNSAIAHLDLAVPHPTNATVEPEAGNGADEPDEEQAMMERDEEGPALDLFNEIGAGERELRGLLDGFPNRPLYDASAVLDDETRKHLTTAASALQFANHCILQASKRVNGGAA